MRNERDAYFSIHHGQKSLLSEIGAAEQILVFQLIQNGKMQGQYILPEFGIADDMVISMPEKEASLTLWKQEQRKELEEKLGTKRPRYSVWKKDTSLLLI